MKLKYFLLLISVFLFIFSCSKEEKYNKYMKNLEIIDKSIVQMNEYEKFYNERIVKTSDKIEFVLSKEKKSELIDAEFNATFYSNNTYAANNYVDTMKVLVAKENILEITEKLHLIHLEFLKTNLNASAEELKKIISSTPKLKELDKQAQEFYSDIQEESNVITEINDYLFNKEYENDRYYMKGTKLYDKYKQISAKRKKSEEIYKELLKQKVF